jgi:surfactin synthase thioesterase subunit
MIAPQTVRTAIWTVWGFSMGGFLVFTTVV